VTLCSFILLCYISGTYASHVLSPILPTLIRPDEPKPIISGGCAVCGEANCSRQRSVGEHQPWTGLEVPREIDQALQDVSKTSKYYKKRISGTAVWLSR